MSLSALYLPRLLPEPVMAVIKERFRLTAVPGQGPPERSALLDGLQGADAMICTLTEAIDGEVLDAAPRLRVIANYAVGFNNIAVDRAKARGIVVTNTPDVLTEATADLTWALLLATARRLVQGQRLVESGAWRGWVPRKKRHWSIVIGRREIEAPVPRVSMRGAIPSSLLALPIKSRVERMHAEVLAIAHSACYELNGCRCVDPALFW